MKTKVKEKILIIDGNALAHRAYHAIPANLFTKKNELVNAVYGFTSMLLNAINVLSPDYVVCAFDAPGPTFRNEMYKQYKEHRKEMDDDLYIQFLKIKEVVETFKIPIFEMKGFEADDVIGSIVDAIGKLKLNLEILILSGDNDILQLIPYGAKVVLPGKSFGDMIIYDEAKFAEKYGFESSHLIDYKALYGDKSDNIPGVKGIGEKSAVELITKFGGIEDIYKHIDAVPQTLKKKLDGNEDIAYLSKKLGTIKRDVPINFKLEDSLLKNYSEKRVIEKFMELEFKSLLKRLPQGQSEENGSNFDTNNEVIVGGKENESKTDTQYVLVRNGKQLKDLIVSLKGKKLFSIDCETTSTVIFEMELVGISIGTGEKRSFYLPVKDGVWNFEKTGKNNELVANSGLWVEFLEVLSNSVYKKIGHNIKFDLHALASAGIKLEGIIFDTMLASYVLGNSASDLKGLAFIYEGVNMTTYGQITNNAKTHINDVDLNTLSDYSCADADLTYRLYERFSKQLELKENAKLKDVFYSIEMPLTSVLFEMERVGVKLNVDFLKKLDKVVDKDIDKLKSQIYSIVGHEFNINSPKQLSDVIFNQLNLPKGRKTKTGYSTDERYFTSIGLDTHEIIKPLRGYKELTKLKSTYIIALPKWVDSKSRVHTSYSQTIAATGRLSSINPNLQNIPVRTNIGNEIRKAFISDPQSVFVSFDYSQIELRIMAHMSNDKVLMESFNNGQDIHYKTAQLIFNKDDIGPEERRVAKTINFGIIYGISAFGLSNQLGIPRDKSQGFINRYFEVYKGVREYIDLKRKEIYTKHYVESLFGRRRSFEGIEKAGAIAQNAMQREAINMPLQATNADIIKIAMDQAYKLILKKGYKSNMLLQIHDELIFEFFLDKEYRVENIDDVKDLLGENPNIQEFCNEIKGIMENVVKLAVPVIVDVSIGKDWGDLIKTGKIAR